jgi:hypothetical protein
LEEDGYKKGTKTYSDNPFVLNYKKKPRLSGFLFEVNTITV